MTLLELTDILAATNSLADLDAFVAANGSQITVTILNASIATSEGLQLFDNTYAAFNNSKAGFEFLEEEKESIGASSLLNLFALVYERESHPNVKAIAAYIKDYSLQKRLAALAVIYTESEFSRNGYSENFPKVVQLLSDAQYDPRDASSDYTGYVLRILHLFKEKGEIFLNKWTAELSHFLSLFKDEKNIKRWPLLIEYNEPVVSISSVIPGFDASKAVSFPLIPSDTFDNLYKEVVSDPLREDERTTFGSLSTPLGYDANYCREHIIEYGTADFRQPCNTEKGVLSPAERVLIYCHFNLRKHYFSSYYIYSAYLDSISPLLLHNEQKLIFLDLGCGPLTSGLAIADLFLHRYGKLIPMNYVGVDIAPAMLEKANEFSDKGVTLFGNCEFDFLLNFSAALALLTDKLVKNGSPIIINASYLFASSSLNITDLAAFISQLHANCPQSPIHVIFQNPNTESKNKKYKDWKSQLPDLKVVYNDVITIEYRNKPFDKSVPERIYYELLSYQ